MSSPERMETEPLQKPERRTRRRRGFGLVSLVFTLVMTACLGVVLYLAMGKPVAAPEWLRAEFAARAEQALDARLEFDALDFVLESGAQPRLRMTNVRVNNHEGVAIVGFAELRAGVSLPDLLRGQALLSDVYVSGVFAQLRRLRDNSLVLSGGLDLTAPQQQAASFAELIKGLDDVLSQPAFTALETFGMQALTLRIEDLRTGRAWTVDGGRALLERAGDDLRITADLALLSGGVGVATVATSYQSQIGGLAAEFGVTLQNMDARDIAVLSPPFAWLDVLRAPISGAMRGGLDENGDIAPLSATLTIGAGVIQPTDATRPVPFETARSYFTFDPMDNTLNFDQLSMQSEWITANIEGQAVLEITEDLRLDALVGQFRSSQLSGNPDQLYDDTLTVDAAEMDFRLNLDPFDLHVGQIVLQDEGQVLSAHGALVAEPDGWRYELDAHMDGISPDRLLSFWPENVVPRTRAWITENLLAGRLLEVDVVLRDAPEQPATTYASFEFDAAKLRYARRLPPVEDARGSASLFDGRFVVSVDQGTVKAAEGGQIDVAGSSFIIPDVTARDAPPAVVRLQTVSSVTAALSVLNQPPLSVMERAGLAVDIADGELTAAGTLTMPIKRGLEMDDIGFDATGTVRNVASDTLVEGRSLRADTLRVVASDTEITLSGPSTFDGIPFEGTWRQPITGSPTASRIDGEIVLSREAVDVLDIGLPPGSVSGRGTGRLALTLPPDEAPPSFTLDSDLRGVALSVAPLGWSKPARASGRLSVSGALGSVPRVDDFVLQAPGLAARGAVRLKSNGQLDRVTFSEVRAGNWLRAPVTLVGRGAGRSPAVEVRGGSVDLREADFGSGGSTSGQAGGPMTLALDRLNVTDSIALTDFKGSFDTARGLDGSFTARVNGRAAVSGQVLPQDGRSAIRILSDDAGAVAASAGLLKKARGGDLSLTLLPVGSASFDGSLKVTSTRVQDAPAIAALLNALSIIGLLEQMGGPGIHFERVDADFRLTPTQMILTKASAVGPSMGISMDGLYNVANSALDMQGVISPVYLLNGLGSILTRPGEGLIGFSYRIRGPSSDPTVLVNPLSALTPGMFREIFRRPPPKLPEVDGETARVPQAFAAEEPEETVEERRLRERREAVEER